MAKKGTRTTQKRLSAPRAVKISRKEKTFIVAVGPGPHSKQDSVPLGVVLRDLLGVSKNARETKICLNSGQVSVDGTTRRERRFPVGLFDVVKVKALEKAYRAVYDSQGRLGFMEIPEKEAEFKLCRVKAKRIVDGNKVQLASSDGKTFFAEAKANLKVGDSLKVGLPGQKILGHYPLAKDCVIYITGGKHVSETAKVKEILEGTLQRGKLLELEHSGKSFRTTAQNAFVIGERKAELALPKGE